MAFVFFEGTHFALPAESKIPMGQGVGSRERDFQLQKRQEIIKRKMQRKKKSEIKDEKIREHSLNARDGKDGSKNGENGS